MTLTVYQSTWRVSASIATVVSVSDYQGLYCIYGLSPQALTLIFNRSSSISPSHSGRIKKHFPFLSISSRNCLSILASNYSDLPIEY